MNCTYLSMISNRNYVSNRRINFPEKNVFKGIENGIPNVKDFKFKTINIFAKVSRNVIFDKTIKF